MILRGIRGATSATDNTEQNILEATKELLEKLLEKNNIQEEDIASIFFSVTPDLNATFPAVAARKLGLNQTPLLCLSEIPVPNALKNCIRILLHVNTTKKQSEITHLYLKDATCLRPELTDS